MTTARKNILDLILVICGKVSSIAVVFIGGVIMARFGGPEQYGLFAASMATVLLIDGMIGSPLDIAAVRFSSLYPDDKPRTHRFEAMAMQLKLIAIAIVLIAWISIAAILHIADFSSVLLVMGVCACLLGTRSVSTNLQINGVFRAYTSIDIVQGLTRIAGFLLLTALGLCTSPAFVMLFGGVSLVIFFTSVSYFKLNHLLKGWPERQDIKHMLGYCGFSAGIICLGTLTGRSDLIILSSWYNSATIANYGVGSQMFMLAVQLALYISIVTQPRLIAWGREGKLRFLFLINVLIVVLATVPALIFYFHPHLLTPIITMVFGAEYDNAGPILSILAFGGLLDLLIVPILMMYVLQVAPSSAFLGELIIALLFIGIAFFLIPRENDLIAQRTMAWLTVGVRANKFLLYLTLFWRATTAKHQVKLSLA